jgi:hypothetical protein
MTRTVSRILILPPIAFARLGSSPIPLDNYSTWIDDADPVGYRKLAGEETLEVDEQSGAIRRSYRPSGLRLKDYDPVAKRWRIRPVAPFLEVWAEVGGALVPLDLALLRELCITPANLSWSVSVENRKVERRTNDPRDRITATLPPFNDHSRRTLDGRAENFVSGGKIGFGSVRYIRPTPEFPEIRFRFTPGKGAVYGPAGVKDPSVPTENKIYGKPKGQGWYGWENVVRNPDGSWPEEGPDRRVKVPETMGPTLYAIDPKQPVWLHNGPVVSRGYLDDACDGTVTVRLTLPSCQVLSASTRVCSAPPNFVLDSGFARTLGDDLEQALLGPSVSADEPDAVTSARAEEIMRRAFETVRFMNVPVLNNNLVRGRYNRADNMPVNDALDFGRPLAPAMAPENADTLAVTRLHQQVLATMKAQIPVWFVRLLRRPEEVGDLTDVGRRKMPALMSGAEGRYMTLTRRQIDIFRKAAKLPKESA